MRKADRASADEGEKNIGAADEILADAHLVMLDDPDFVEGMTNIDNG